MFYIAQGGGISIDIRAFDTGIFGVIKSKMLE